MSASSAFLEARTYAAGTLTAQRGVALAADFGAPAAEYAAARASAALFDYSDRGRIVVTGRDRKAWLHNLVTSAVTTSADYRGVYAFAVTVKGRILFDLNILALPDALWLDVDGPTVPVALAHFDRFLFTEDVRLAGVTSARASGGDPRLTCDGPSAATGDARLACSGPQAAEVARRIGVADLAAVPELAVVELSGMGGWLIRHDALGLPGFELILPRAPGPLWWDQLVGHGARPAGWRVREALRIEAGRPAMGGDLEDNVLPAETGQRERAVSDTKGCYLGHEIVERMRSRGVLAKRLVRLQLHDGAGLTLPAPLFEEGAASGPPSRRSETLPPSAAFGPPVGQLTSLVAHPARSDWIGLGYVKTPVPDSAALVVGEPPRAVTIVAD